MFCGAGEEGEGLCVGVPTSRLQMVLHCCRHFGRRPDKPAVRDGWLCDRVGWVFWGEACKGGLLCTDT